MELILSFLKEHFSVVTVSGIGIVLLALLLVIFA